MRTFIARQEMFFLSTADGHGECNVTLRSRVACSTSLGAVRARATSKSGPRKGVWVQVPRSVLETSLNGLHEPVAVP
jgi:hypothetical protein